MAVIVVLALIVIGPKDLPRILRTLGQWMGKARRLANEFQRGMDQLAREAGVDDLKRQVQGVASLNPTTQIKKAVFGGATEKPTPEPAQASAKSNGELRAAAPGAPGPAEPASTPTPREPDPVSRA